MEYNLFCSQSTTVFGALLQKALYRNQLQNKKDDIKIVFIKPLIWD